MASSIPEEFLCPITLDIMKDPVLCEDGYTYERSAIMSIRNSSSPMTRQRIDKTKLIPNGALKNVINRFLSSNTEYQSILLDKKKKDEEKHEQELKVKQEMERKLEKERLEKEKREQEERRKIEELRRMREERYLQEKREKERRIKYEEDQRRERLRLEQVEQQRIKDDKDKKMTLLAKYNELNPSFEYGIKNTYGMNGNKFFTFEKPKCYANDPNRRPLSSKHKFVFDIKFIESIKNDKSYSINYKKLIQEYDRVNKYINGPNPFLEFVFDEIIPNIDTIIDEISTNLKSWEDTLERHKANPGKEMGGSIDRRWWDNCITPLERYISNLNQILHQYTSLKPQIPKLQSKEYNIVNQSEQGIFSPHGDLNMDIKTGMISYGNNTFHGIHLNWVKKKIAMMDSLVLSINTIVKNQEIFRFIRFMLYNPGGSHETIETINILDSYKDYVYWDTHVKDVDCSRGEYGGNRPPGTMTKDYTFDYFEPLMILAKNIMDLTEEVMS